MPEKPFPSILLVEDDYQAIYLIQRYVRKIGGQLMSADTCQKTLELATRTRPDVIFIDIVLSGTTGWEVLRALRSDPLTSEIPAVICSNLPVKLQSIAAGAEDYLQKPILYQHFLDALSRLGLPVNGQRLPTADHQNGRLREIGKQTKR